MSDFSAYRNNYEQDKKKKKDEQVTQTTASDSSSNLATSEFSSYRANLGKKIQITPPETISTGRDAPTNNFWENLKNIFIKSGQNTATDTTQFITQAPTVELKPPSNDYQSIITIANSQLKDPNPLKASVAGSILTNASPSYIADFETGVQEQLPKTTTPLTIKNYGEFQADLKTYKQANAIANVNIQTASAISSMTKGNQIPGVTNYVVTPEQKAQAQKTVDDLNTKYGKDFMVNLTDKSQGYVDGVVASYTSGTEYSTLTNDYQIQQQNKQAEADAKQKEMDDYLAHPQMSNFKDSLVGLVRIPFVGKDLTTDPERAVAINKGIDVLNQNVNLFVNTTLSALTGGMLGSPEKVDTHEVSAPGDTSLAAQLKKPMQDVIGVEGSIVGSLMLFNVVSKLIGATGIVADIAGSKAVTGVNKVGDAMGKFLKLPTTAKLFSEGTIQQMLTFGTMGQINPDLKPEDRVGQFIKDAGMGVIFDKAGLIKNSYVAVPTFFSLGYVTTKLDGGSDKDALIAGATLSAFHLYGKFKEKVNIEKMKTAVTDEAINILNKYGNAKLTADSTLAEIKDVYRKVAKEYHPDRNKGTDAESIFIKINSAYNVLTNPLIPEISNEPKQLKNDPNAVAPAPAEKAMAVVEKPINPSIPSNNPSIPSNSKLIPSTSQVEPNTNPIPPTQSGITSQKPTPVSQTEEIAKIANVDQTDIKRTPEQGGTGTVEDYFYNTPEQKQNIVAKLDNTERKTYRFLDKEVQKEYVAKTEELMGNMLTQLVNSEPGRRELIGAEGDYIGGWESTKQFIGVKSTFPDWIPGNARTTELVNKFFEKIPDTININTPNPFKEGSRLADMYNAFMGQVESQVEAPKLTEVASELVKNNQMDQATVDSLLAKIQAPEFSKAQTEITKEGIGITKASRDIKAVATELGKGQLIDLATYKKMSMDEQRNYGDTLANADPEYALSVALGNETPEGDIRAGAVYGSLLKKAIAESDVSLMMQLAESKIGTEAGQALKAFDVGWTELAESADPVKIIKKVNKELERVAKERNKGLSKEKVVAKEKAKIKEEIPKVKKNVWAEFIDSIQC